MLQLVSTLALIGAGAPFALPALVALMVVFYRLYHVYQASMIQIKRLDATSRWGRGVGGRKGAYALVRFHRARLGPLTVE
jgi:hypothetical protein